MSDAIPMSEISGLSSDSAFKSLLLFFCLVLLLSVLSFSANDPDLLQKTLKHFSFRVGLFCMALVEQLGVGRWYVQLAAIWDWYF